MIGLLDAHNDNYEKIASLTRPGKLRYCRRHGYQFVEHVFGDLDRTPHWGRILAIQEHLPKFEWLLYLDSDTIITNPEVKIEPHIDPRYDVTVGRMPKWLTGKASHLSTSAMLIKNTEWVLNFLPKWWEQRQFINAPYHADPEHDRGATLGGGGMWFEQSAYQFLYDTDDDCYNHTRLMPDSWFNHRKANHDDSCFLIHVTTNERGYQDKLDRMKEKLRSMICFL